MILKVRLNNKIIPYYIKGIKSVILSINGYEEEEFKSDNIKDIKKYIIECIEDYNVTSITLQDKIAYIQALYY